MIFSNPPACTPTCNSLYWYCYFIKIITAVHVIFYHFCNKHWSELSGWLRNVIYSEPNRPRVAAGCNRRLCKMTTMKLINVLTQVKLTLFPPSRRTGFVSSAFTLYGTGERRPIFKKPNIELRMNEKASKQLVRNLMLDSPCASH